LYAENCNDRSAQNSCSLRNLTCNRQSACSGADHSEQR
jgi:hypothetical protein